MARDRRAARAAAPDRSPDFYRALAVFLADRLRASQPRATVVADPDVIPQDELDIGILDNVFSAGERLNRMLRILAHPQ